ncbi:uncharacterized protein N7483_000895 [Penicillium malachiteum]|uniref:uncharacterized protein n=1 Tax=Penicillium malachiteum TaxID=1324776 RepID=UPI00254801B4|nr:uncharacterized protein N7483_000895 [Penicillium malachiteum]KAJ5735770.1 hypothetical protein N7483_000895 [Penicillium malachiteum]
MMGVNGLQGTGMATAFARQRLAASPRSTRSISTFRTQRVRIAGPGASLTSGFSATASRWAIPAIAGPAAVRFNSTSPTSVSPPETAPGELPNIEDLSSIDISKIPEHIGYLKELGLDFGWGPSAFMQWTLEHIHLGLGLPWWASVVSLGLLVRLALLKPSLDASNVAAQNHNIKPLMAPLREKLMLAAKSNNQVEIARARAEIKNLNAAHNIKVWKSFVPMLQIPLGFGMFRTIRGMTTLPVPALLDEKALWLTDLTAADPYFILPAISGFCLYHTFKKGGEAGMTELFNTSAGKSVLYALPAMSFLFMIWMPSALQLYFTATGAWALAQAHVVNNKSFRQFMKMEIPQQTSAASAASALDDSLSRLQRSLQEERQRRLQQAKEQLATTVAPEHQSFIDRWLKAGKDHAKEVGSDITDKMKQFTGASTPNTTNADGTPAAPPRLTEAQRKAALKEEEAQSAWEKEERDRRNEERRRAHMQTMQNEMERAKGSFAKQKKGSRRS